jgi:predicted tellurium resistance membrane protein TerC
VYFGAIIGIVLLRFAAGVFVRLLERFPTFDHVAYLLVGWVGVKLLLMAGHSYEKSKPAFELPFSVPEMPIPVFWAILLAIAGLGTWWAVRHPSDSHELDQIAEEVEEGQDLTFTPEETADDPERIR